MNVRPGDLAVVVMDDFHAHNVGAFVRVVRWSFDYPRRACWECVAMQPMTYEDGDTVQPGELGGLDDYQLRPIRGLAGAKSVAARVGDEVAA